MSKKLISLLVTIVLTVSLFSTALAADWSINYRPGAPSSVSNQLYTVYMLKTNSYYYLVCTSSSVPSSSYSPYISVTNSNGTGTFSFAHAGSYNYYPHISSSAVNTYVTFTAQGNATISAKGVINMPIN